MDVRREVAMQVKVSIAVVHQIYAMAYQHCDNNY